jgi:hypothetical protein
MFFLILQEPRPQSSKVKGKTNLTDRLSPLRVRSRISTIVTSSHLKFTSISNLELEPKSPANQTANPKDNTSKKNPTTICTNLQKTFTPVENILRAEQETSESFKPPTSTSVSLPTYSFITTNSSRDNPQYPCLVKPTPQTGKPSVIVDNHLIHESSYSYPTVVSNLTISN